jgi:hypothetical protein
MSIRPAVIDRTGERPCVPLFYIIAKRLADGRGPSLADRARKLVAMLCRKLAR